MSSFRRKPESSNFNKFWMPDQVRHDGVGTFYEAVNIDSLVKSQKTSFFVIPAKAGIQCFQKLMTNLDPGFRRGDERILGDGKFDENVLSTCQEQLEKKYTLINSGVTTDEIAIIAAKLVNTEPGLIFSARTKTRIFR